MSNVIQFLEAMGRDAGAATLSNEAYATEVQALGLDDGIRDPLLQRDEAQLNRLLGGRTNVLMILAPAKEEPQEDETDDDGEDDQEAPQQLRSATVR